MRSSELAKLEAARRTERPSRRRRSVHRDVKPANVRNLRAEVEEQFRAVGARVWRDEETR